MEPNADDTREELKEAYHIALDLDDMLESLDLDGGISSELSDCIYDIKEPLDNLRKCLTRELRKYSESSNE